MKEILFVYFILIASFVYCGQYEGPSNDKAHCKVLSQRNQTDLYSCTAYFLFYDILTSPSEYANGKVEPPAIEDSRTKQELYDIVLLKCLITKQNEIKCNHKSQYSPVWESAP